MNMKWEPFLSYGRFVRVNGHGMVMPNKQAVESYKLRNRRVEFYFDRQNKAIGMKLVDTGGHKVSSKSGGNAAAISCRTIVPMMREMGLPFGRYRLHQLPDGMLWFGNDDALTAQKGAKQDD